MPHVAGEPQLFKQADRGVAKVRLAPVPSEARLARASVMVAMPIFALKEVHECQPSHVAAGVPAKGSVRLRVAYAVHEALRMQRKNQAD